jgi:FkbM family methyltransferase
MIDANLLENWSQLEGDTQLRRAVKKINKDTDCNLTILDYQKDYLDKALSFVKNFRTAIDAGAHYGVLTYHLNSVFSQVHSFEIYPAVRECLKENVKKFNLSNTLVHEYGLGETEKSVSLDLERGTFGTHIDPNTTSGNIPITTIDSLNLTNLDFIKIDCEGYEPFILQGGERTIKLCSPVILMERKGHTERWGLDKFEPVKILERWGYVTAVSYHKDCIMIRR